MIAAVFSDVHGNLPALVRFIAATRGVAEAYVCLGDVVDYGPWNDECLGLIRELPQATILQGNHERLFLGTENLADERPLVQEFFRCSHAFFTRPDWIADLPAECRLGSFRCLHTLTGRSVYPDSAVELAGNVFIGHSHHSFVLERSGFRIANPGSVGQNRKWIDRVDYLLFDTETESIQPCSLPYDVDAFLAELRRHGYPPPCLAYYENKPRAGH